MGRGPRKYDTMELFLSAIADRYQPLDTVWCAGAWNNVETRKERLQDCKHPGAKWALEVVFGPQGLEVTPHGAVPAMYR